MITFWKTGAELIRLQELEKNCWVHVELPDRQEVEFLTNQLNAPPDFLQDVLDIDERSRLEFDEDWSMLILRVPLNHKYNGVPFITVPLGIMINSGYIITVCSQENEIVSTLIRQMQTKKFNGSNRFDLILQIFNLSATWFLKFLKEINIQTAVVEKDLEKSTRNKELHKLLRLEKSLVYFITSLKSNELLLAKLKNSRWFKSNEYDEDILEDAMIETKQAIEMANIYSDIQSGMMDAFASVISNNLNMVMKRLTSVTIILMIPTLVASFYGMNLPNGMENSSWSFGGVVAFSLLLSGIGVYTFRKKNWF